MRRRRHLTLATTAVLLLSACGGDAVDDPAPTAATTRPDDVGAADGDAADGAAAGDGATDGTVPEPTASVTEPGSDDPGEGDLDDVTWEVRTLADGLDGPVQVLAAPGDERLLVVEQVGRVRVMDADGDDEEPAVALDLTDRVLAGGERGLLGMALSPAFATDGRVFVHYSGRPDGRTVLSELVADPSTLVVDPGSERVLLEVAQPAGNHNGGSVVFAPDGTLLLALGDGGAANDRFGNGQRTDTLLGAILRLDVSEPGRAVPAAGNPHLAGGGAPEVLHHGLRNPYRVTVHEDVLVIADVGQNAVEEVDVVDVDARGLNFGWPVFEGDRCFDGPCDDPSRFVAPATTYGHDDDGGCSIIGGAVYDGPVAPLRDHYVYGDFCTGLVRSFRIDGLAAADERDWTAEVGPLNQVTSFSGVAGEVLATLADGRVLHLVPSLG